MKAPRVASLLPSATELVYAAGGGPQLVGRSHECDHPPQVESLPILTRSRLQSDLPSVGIDGEVRRLVADALAIYQVDVDGLAAAAPEVILTQDLCAVCAVSKADVHAALGSIGLTAQVVALSPTRLAEVWDDLERVGEAIGRADSARAARRALEGRVAAIAARRPTTRPKVLSIEWLDPIMIGGTWMPELIEAAGGEALVTGPGDHAPTLTEPQLAELAPEVVLLKPCGFCLARTREEYPALRALLDRLDWPAWREGRVWVADGNAFFNRSGPRLVESLEILAACLHPTHYADLAERHAGWFERLEPA